MAMTDAAKQWESQRWVASTGEPDARDLALGREIERHYPQLVGATARLAYSSVHDIVVVEAAEARFAVKLYRHGVRTAEEIGWEVGLQHHLLQAAVPVMPVIEGASGPMAWVEVDGIQRA